MKQCDANCPPDCDNARIYITGLPTDVTVEELVELFGGIGQVGAVLCCAVLRSPLLSRMGILQISHVPAGTIGS